MWQDRQTQANEPGTQPPRRNLNFYSVSSLGMSDPERKNLVTACPAYAVTGPALQVPSSRHLRLREAAISEQFHSCDIAAVVGGEKYDSLRNLV